MGRDNSQRTFRDEYNGAKAPTKLIVSEPGKIREELDNDRIHTALLLASTKAEAISAKKLQQYFEVHHVAFEELVGNESLGTYIDKCNENDLIDEDYKESVKNLVEKRNRLAHDFGYLHQLTENYDEMEEVRNIIEDCCNWFDTLHQSS